MINKDELKNALKLYLVTDSDILKGRDFYKCIEDAIKSGVTMVQLREKNTDGKEFLEKAIKLRELTNKYNVTFVINDRIDIAMLCDAVYPELAVKSIDEKADYIIKEIADIVKDTNIPTSLEEFGVKPDDLDFLVQAGSQQTRLLVNNCKELSLDDIRYIYKKVM